jgi:hypothetical protein
MRTKIRLALDCSIQVILICLLIFQIKSSPTFAIQHVGIFAFVISIWQIIHAVYVVEKYQDWYGGLYLKSIEKVIWVTIFLLASGVITAVATFGAFLPYILQVLQVLGLGLGLIVALLAFQYFGRSLHNIYDYYNEPRSFWDL